MVDYVYQYFDGWKSETPCELSQALLCMSKHTCNCCMYPECTCLVCAAPWKVTYHKIQWLTYSNFPMLWILCGNSLAAVACHYHDYTTTLNNVIIDHFQNVNAAGVELECNAISWIAESTVGNGVASTCSGRTEIDDSSGKVISHATDEKATAHSLLE